MKNNIFTKIISILLIITAQLSADENWIPIKSMQTHQTQKKHLRQDLNLSQIEPLNKMMKNATLIKQLLTTTSKTKKVVNPEKNWFVLNK